MIWFTIINSNMFYNFVFPDASNEKMVIMIDKTIFGGIAMDGKCYYCGKEISKRGISRHLKSCAARKEYAEKHVSGKKKLVSLYVLNIADKYDPNYWIYAAIHENAKLEDLDTFLREVWLECCGHLSAFEIDGVSYDSKGDYDGDDWELYEDENMDKKIKEIIDLGDKFSYEYDFGSTTSLVIKVVDVIKGYKPENDIEIMARNSAPKFQCEQCENEARYYCADCSTALCSECQESHECDEEYIEGIPENANSPRDGVCGYCGTEDDDDVYRPKVLASAAR
jgi:hypothetical protein